MENLFLENPVLHITIFLSAGIIAGWVDSIAGGGGLITLPVLLNAGIPPTLALGTNKLQSSFGSLTASVRYLRSHHVSFKKSVPGIAFTFAGASTGTWLVQRINPSALGKIIPLLLVAIIVYLILSPNAGHLDKKSKLPVLTVFLVCGLSIGFYDGFFGPGTGNFWAIALVSIAGFNLVKATGYTKVMNFTSNFAALLMFIVGGNVLFHVGILMAIGQIIGARIGAGMVLKKGVKFVRPVFLTVVIILTLKLFYNNYLK
jgi:uncharacterized membrane protein YfcA